MNPTKIKICGLTTPANAALAVSMGADFVGVILTGSPRRVDLGRAAEIRAAIPAARLVGVFRDPSLEELVGAVREAGLDLLQLHGQESWEFCREAQTRTGRPVIKAFAGVRVLEKVPLASYTTPYLLFDTCKEGLEAADEQPKRQGKKRRSEREEMDRRWVQVARVGRRGMRVFLAGGLTPDNVRAAVAAARPFAVDVCRGVESAPGIKDPVALQRFIAEVHP